MKEFLSKSSIFALSAVLMLGAVFTACKKDDAPPTPPVLVREDIKVDVPAGGFVIKAGQLLRVTVESALDEGVAYLWLLDEQKIASTKNLEYMFETIGEYKLTLEVTMGKSKFSYEHKLVVNSGEVDPPSEVATAYITKVLDFMPAVGQFTNKLPLYVEGDTQETMNAKVLAAIGNNNKSMISLGGFGGYVVVGFDHTIQNVKGKRDFRVLGNAFYADSKPDGTPEGGSCEPGIIMVAYDLNKNGVPDNDEWYEIAGSSHKDPTQEPWYERAKKSGNNMNFYRDYQITYHRPKSEPISSEEWSTYIRWEDNKGDSGYKSKISFHQQSYFPLWVKEDRITFKGTCLPQNGIDESGNGTNYVLYKFLYGYADNEKNSNDNSAIDIDWAVDINGQKVDLPGVDFIKIYTGINQDNGWIGECSTEVTGIEDLHILGVDIDSKIDVN